MKSLFDQGTPSPLRHALTGHEIITAYERGWHGLQNGDVLRSAEVEGFVVLVTKDTNLRYQQNLANRQLAILVLMTTGWRRIRRHVELLAGAIAAIAPGCYVELPFPPA